MSLLLLLLVVDGDVDVAVAGVDDEDGRFCPEMCTRRNPGCLQPTGKIHSPGPQIHVVQ